MQQEKKKFNLNMHVARLLMDEPFFAAISRRIDKRASNAVPTAGVMVNPTNAQFEMIYNPDFFERLTDAERTAVLKHEYYHVIYMHVTERLPEGGMSKRWNIATDLAINSHIADLPKGACIPGDGPFVDMPRGMSADWYMKNLPTPKEKDSSQGEGEGDGLPEPLDDHSGWDKVPNDIKDMANERLKDILRKSSEEAAKNNGWGSVSSECRRKIMDSIKSKVDWRKVLRYFIKTSQRSNKTSSIKRINKRYPYIHSGRKTNRVAKVAISIDQSGSVSDNMLATFFTELNKLSELAEFTIIPFDTTVEPSLVSVWRKGEKKNWERVLAGGTCFDAPTEYVNNGNFDGHIVLTDLQAPKPKRSNCQRLWMTTPEYAERPYFSTKEKIIALE
tara:strand:- start:1241 stop:2407 length:1167 start_codon:yes stop_codon:yes gene_type:complete